MNHRTAVDAPSDAALKANAEPVSPTAYRTSLAQQVVSETHLRQMLSDSDLIGIARMTISGEVLDANETFLNMVGYTREEVIAGKVRWSDMTPKEWSAKDAAALEELRTSGKTTPYEKEYFRKDGSRVPILVKAVLELNSESVCVAFILDLSEQHQARRSSQASEDRYRALADAMPQLVWATDKDGSHFYYNQQWYDFTGLSVEESMGFGFTKALHPDDKERTLKRWERAWRAGEGYEIEYRFYSRPQGEYRWFLGRATPVKDSTGNIAQWVGTCTDIHEQKQMEVELARANAERERLYMEVSTPIVPVWQGVVAIPLIGTLDEQRMQRATDAALGYVMHTNAHSCIIDITGARIGDSNAIAHLTNLVAALKLVGAEAVVTGVTAQAARSLVQLGLDTEQMRTQRTLAEALADIIKRQQSGNLKQYSLQQGTGFNSNGTAATTTTTSSDNSW